MSKLKSIDTARGLYVIEEGGGFSCRGFDNAEKLIQGVLAWMGFDRRVKATPGTAEHYAEYLAVMAEGAKYASDNGSRCPAELIPALVGLEGKRVEVTLPDGERARFYVGKSTGWMPCHLEIKTRRSSGGGAVYFPEGSTVRAVGGSR